MTPSDDLYYDRYLLIHRARQQHIRNQLAADWERRRHRYWPIDRISLDDLIAELGLTEDEIESAS